MPVTPNLLLKANLAFPAEYAYWEFNDNTGDPFYGFPYKWQTTLVLQPQAHSNHTTTMPNFYDGNDVKVGDWFASGVAGRALMISEILSTDGTNLEVILEDYERYNLFTNPDQSATGLCPDGNGIIFRLGEDGLPALGPIEEGYLPSQTVDDLMARFIGHNLIDQVLVHQADHGFMEGDVIYADFEADSGYKKVTAVNFNRAIGIVTEINVPGLEYFRYRPLGKLINNVNPPLWGAHGDIFYLDPNEPGALTNVKPANNAVPVYLQLDLPTRAILLERGAESVSSGPTTDSATNKYDVGNVVAGQTTFTMPSDCKEVLYMAINGIENENFTFNTTTKVLVFDPIETGYGIDVDDEVFFIYKT